MNIIDAFTMWLREPLSLRTMIMIGGGWAAVYLAVIVYFTLKHKSWNR